MLIGLAWLLLLGVSIWLGYLNNDVKFGCGRCGAIIEYDGFRVAGPTEVLLAPTYTQASLVARTYGRTLFFLTNFSLLLPVVAASW